MPKASDRAYSTIRRLILSGELPPGAPLREEALAQKCGVSRTPIREALNKLESGMLICRTDSQRSYVAEYSTDEMADLLEIISVIEGMLARRAAARIPPDVMKKMVRCYKAAYCTTGQTPIQAVTYINAAWRFHALVAKVAASTSLSGMLVTLGQRIVLPIRDADKDHYGADELLRWRSAHGELLVAFALRDEAWAEKAMTSHMRWACHTNSQILRDIFLRSRESGQRKLGGQSSEVSYE
ncbi:GntR family transcriptional regulator [uncultured Parasphingorhabdus sp.]|uniref:GntR family transcriptional regulator n=1 Tax=uncultured Parasphingorhabdus sp. TaxID=2709694 RepID=UPI002AA93F9C|nr:GntR family transcriptional regulator [uncultured Parasphingorhabdus sp.]